MALKLAAPWTTYYRQVQAIFKEDPEVKVLFDEEAPALKIYVDNATKAEALTELLPTEKEFGNVTLGIEIIPSDKNTEDKGLIKNAFEGNGAVNFIYDIEYVFSNTLTYVIFKKEVVQFFNDDLSDIHGVCSTLYQDIAKELFDVKGVFFCTDTDPVDSIGKPLGEWP